MTRHAYSCGGPLSYEGSCGAGDCQVCRPGTCRECDCGCGEKGSEPLGDCPCECHLDWDREHGFAEAMREEEDR